MDYAWKVLLPLALINTIVTGYLTYCDWYFPIWKENNWRIWTMYIKPLFANKPTNYFGIPIISIIAILVIVEIILTYMDRVREAKQAEKPD
jgi:NADH:ubiquinone oxidoreductase subunit H